jgi:ATP-dependent Clp protease ATP-binding subunit ClpC
VFERFTDRARRALALAQEEARLLNHSFIGTEHLLLGVISEGGGVGAHALDSLGISLEAAREKVKETIGISTTAPLGSPPFTPRAKKVLELSFREALQMNHDYIGTEHLLLGLVHEGEGVAATVLVSLGADLPRVRQRVMILLSGGREALGDLPEHDIAGTAGPPSVPLEPCCPRCRRSLQDSARFRTIAVSSDDQRTSPMSIEIVYCRECSTTLHMFRKGH